jgi:hypothetical protein
MHEDSQILIPDAFVELYRQPGGHDTRIPAGRREEIAARYELCEDLAQLLTETAQAQHFELVVTESAVLERIHRGLMSAESPVAPVEAGWVTGRLAEVLGWPLPMLPGTADGAPDPHGPPDADDR